MSGGTRRIWGETLDGIDIDGLIQLAYESAAGQRPWDEFAAQLAQATGFDWVMLCHRDRTHPQRALAGAYNVDPGWRARYESHFQYVNPYCDHLDALDPASGEILVLDDPELAKEIEASEFYSGYMRPQEMRISGNVYMVVLNDMHVRSAIVLMRREGNEVSATGTLELGRALMPHLQTALQVNRRLDELERAHSGLRAALDRLPQGVALLDANGRVLLTNRRAGDVLDAHDGLALEAGQLCSGEPDAQPLLRAVDGATAGSRGAGTSVGSVLHVRRPSRRRSYELLLCPLDDGDKLEPGLRPAAVAFISDPDNDAPLSTAQALRETYALTRRESEVALGVLRGETIQDIASALGLGRETVKTHLAGVYGKTGCRGQAELVRRLLLGVGALQAPAATQ